ncbi:hypothetical protein ACJMK2_022850 [Sinanodonta woodiana]|uniref:Iodothyronine deiodinase n=1 Tax=Sinanodonta woodiana TaxID=1069815 RepID=A0ABD3TN45_SINWO
MDDKVYLKCYYACLATIFAVKELVSSTLISVVLRTYQKFSMVKKTIDYFGVLDDMPVWSRNVTIPIGWKTFTYAWGMYYEARSIGIKQGQIAPNPLVVSLIENDDVSKRLLDYVNQSRPLVISFGSCT